MSCKASGIRIVSMGILAASLILPMAAKSESPVDDPAYRVVPSSAPAGRPFTLRLLGAPGDCHTVFHRESVTVVGKRIDLSFVAHYRTQVDSGMIPGKPLPEPLCPESGAGVDTLTSGGNATMVADAPTYAMPSLAAGTYEVWFTEMHECLYTQPMCKIAVRPQQAGKLEIRADGSAAYILSPDTAEAGTAFRLNLLSYQFNCGTKYEMLASAVVGDTISLSFIDHADPAAICPAVYKPYGPAFDIGPLKEGKYHVLAYRLPACAAQGCLVAPAPVPAGTLTVTGAGDRKGWFLERREVPAERAFAMRVLNHAYGNCQTSFSGQTLTIEPAAVHVGFAVKNHPERVCVTDTRPHGPTIEMPAMKPGAYPVYVSTWPYCEEGVPCKLPLTISLAPVDTLIVTRSSSVLASALRAGAKASASFEGGRVHVNLPQGGRGDWKAELFAVTGRRLAGAEFSGQGGSTVVPDFGVSPERGIYRLRLRAPDGKIQTLPLVRKD